MHNTIFFKDMCLPSHGLIEKVKHLNCTKKRRRTQSLLDSFYYLIVLSAIFFALGITAAEYRNFIMIKRTGYEELRTAIGKADHLKKNADNFDIIFFGDSRTYVGIDPDIVSNITGKRAFNYGSMSHWFQTQYPQLKQMAPYLKNKTVIWTIGHINFGKSTQSKEVNNTFYLTPKDYIEYLLLGYEPDEIFDNLLLFFTRHHFVLFYKDLIQRKFNNILEEKISFKKYEKQFLKDIPLYTDKKGKIAKSVYNKYDDIFEMDFTDGKEVKDVMCHVFRKNGQMVFIEINSDYLRGCQKECEGQLRVLHAFDADKKYEEIFNRMLKIFKKWNVDLIVNEYWDAPYHYNIQANTRIYRDYMSRIEEKIKSYGFRYIKTDFSDFTDELYFDYNHLNSVGSEKYSKRLGRVIDKER